MKDNSSLSNRLAGGPLYYEAQVNKFKHVLGFLCGDVHLNKFEHVQEVLFGDGMGVPVLKGPDVGTKA